MNWVYFIDYRKNEDGVLTLINPSKKLVDEGNNELAVQAVSMEEFVQNSSIEYLSEFYGEVRAELDSSLDIIIPRTPSLDEPPMSQKSLNLATTLGLTLSSAMAIGLLLRYRTNND